MKITTAAALAFLTIGVVGACAETRSGSGSNSNWAKCTVSTECASIVPGAYCSGGHCVDPREAGTSPDGGPLTCAARTQSIGAEIHRATANADKSCTVDADCTAVGLAGRCYESCE